MKERFKRVVRKSAGKRFFQIGFLAGIMLAVGGFTIYASINTFEVIARQDLPYSNVIIDVELTSSTEADTFLANKLRHDYEEGSFGIPKKMKLPEARKHIDIIESNYDNGWKASKGIGHTFLTTDQRQKVFGQAVIYMRVNTPTTQDLGDVLWGDIVNVVTTEGWQLGYQVRELKDDPSKLSIPGKATTSEIIVVLIDEQSGEIRSFKAILTKVGERI